MKYTLNYLNCVLHYFNLLLVLIISLAASEPTGDPIIAASVVDYNICSFE